MNFYLKITLATLILSLSYSIIPILFQDYCLQEYELDYINDKFNTYKVCFYSREQMLFYYNFKSNKLYENFYKHYYFNRTEKELDEDSLYMSKSLLSSSNLSSSLSKSS